MKSSFGFGGRQVVAARWLVAVEVALLVVLASGCAALDQDAPKVPSYAIASGAGTKLGVAFGGERGAHPGQSGFDVLATGANALLARAALADAAEQTLDLQYYSVTQDPSTELLLERVVSAAQRGVRVRILLDDIERSTRAFAERALAAEPSIQVRLFHPFLNRPWFGVGRVLEFLVDSERLNRRMHNKLWVADNAMAIFGSRNLGDAYFDDGGAGNFSDVDLLAIGPVVPDLSRGFDEYWNSASTFPISPGSAGVPEIAQRRGTGSAACSATLCRSLSDNPYLRGLENGTLSLAWGRATVAYDRPDGIKQVIGYGIQHGMSDGLGPGSTESELLFISPYFIPSREGLRHLGDMRRRGVRVALLTNSLASTDAPAAHGGYARYRADLLDDGVELYELRPEPGELHQAPHLWPRASASSLHAKVIVVDRARSVVGSLNQDPRSRLYNTESWVSIDSKELAAALARLFDEGTQAHHSFRLRMRGDALEWVTEENGREARYDSEPLASRWKRFMSSVPSVLVPEDLL